MSDDLSAQIEALTARMDAMESNSGPTAFVPAQDGDAFWLLFGMVLPKGAARPSRRPGPPLRTPLRTNDHNRNALVPCIIPGVGILEPVTGTSSRCIVMHFYER